MHIDPVTPPLGVLLRATQILFVALILSWSPELSAGELSQVPGTKLSLEPPPDFVLAEQFPGFQRADAGASIMVTEMPAPVAKIRAGFTRDALASRGMTLVERTSTTASGRDAMLLHVTQTAQGVLFEKWLLVFGDEAQTVMIAATFPESVSESLSDPIRRSVLSVRWDPEQQVGLFDGLTFRVSETPSLKISTRMSNALLLTTTGQKTVDNPEDPIAVVGTSVGSVEIADLEAFSRRRLAQTVQIADLSNVDGRPGKVDGMQAYELRADAKDVKTGTPLKVYQMLITDGSVYFIVYGQVGRGKAGQYLPEFEQLAASLRRKS
jgi:hypothetical protein